MNTPFKLQQHQGRLVGILLLFVGCLLSTCTGTKEPGFLVGTQRLQVIDMHLHPGEWSQIPPQTQRFLASRFPFPLKLDPEGLAGSVLTAEGILVYLPPASPFACG